ncbi:peptidase [Stenotrophomonas maltophilia]|uniref:S41 family peptidase n=1 Tax=Stenotrophomonas maltophilia TaxID=40324 RepID=UPI0013DA0E7E|nr:S41 family peptidase [Stenotrophomonas maltophilia]MBA0281212.1 peptidase [Stenotrophomonas maltophilia]MBA0346362.1 peptidase [Stenotrophomonas maltophilia]MBA0359446.1 peptidase [Stenotrophomonas maltophilia]MBA0521418.1 peptidase [Stenotrophomonas maltophilia]
MQFRKGARRIGALMMTMLAADATAATTPAAEVPSPEAQAQILDMLEHEALYQDKVVWPAARKRLASLQAYPGALQTALREIIVESTGGHGVWMTLARKREATERSKQVGADAVARAKVVGAVDTRIGWVVIEGYAATPGATRQDEFNEDIQRALQWQNVIRSKDSGDRCGWIVDLRSNSGGNMWPMLLGVAPLLRTSPTGTEEIGSFATASAPQRWSLTPAMVQVDGRPRLGFGRPGYSLKQPGAPVAVLVGSNTASSGEATMLSFRGRPQARSFGQSTAGFSTSNVTRTLVDGSVLAMTIAVMKDRNGGGAGARITPDELTTGDAATLAAAQQWLLAQPACQGS